MYNKKHPTFRYQINTTFIGRHFKEHNRNGKYITYVSKNFYGAVIRSKIPLLRLEKERVAISVRLKGRGDRKQSVTGIKVDVIPQSDDRIDNYGLVWDDLPIVDITINNIPGNIMLNPQPSLLTAFFYKRKDGSTVINFIEE